MLKMQQEAVRRAREMQNRARPAPVPPSRVPPPKEVRQEPQMSNNSNNNNNNNGGGFSRQPIRGEPRKDKQSGIFEALFKDKEKTLILSLILLLMDEKSDNSLMLALLYLLI